jgi:CheY-like chemotaxis protein
MTIVVFWLDSSATSRCRVFTDLQMMDALSLCQRLRNDDSCRHITISSEMTAQVGRNGADAVEDGLLPGGSVYEWKKRRL